jgi:hypothetical protein
MRRRQRTLRRRFRCDPLSYLAKLEADLLKPELFMRAKRVHGIRSITSYNRTINHHTLRSEPA